MAEEKLDDGDKKLLSDIEKYGVHIVHILADEENPPFGFSVGLFKNYNHPEIIMAGLKRELIHSLINDMAADIKNGKIFTPYSYYNDIIDGFGCYFIEVDKSNYRKYMGYASWYYNGSNFPVVQCIYPTTKGIYPWQKEWPENLKMLQPLLGPVNQN
ncbi:DUF4262 domain-containing protein [Mucilaginibacter sp.]|uniref:DUF4262 domain-containing protein n=1 Tax=Mucilaginibacter sp. TaxID=1882438 RepID=UPI003D10323D